MANNGLPCPNEINADVEVIPCDEAEANKNTMNAEETKKGNEIASSGNKVSPSELTDNSIDAKKTGKEEHTHKHEEKTISKTTIFILMLAFGIHEFFEGIAFGLMDSTDAAVQLAVGIIIHKTCAALSLGASFSKAGFTACKIAIFMLCFSISTPLGIVIGMNI